MRSDIAGSSKCHTWTSTDGCHQGIQVDRFALNRCSLQCIGSVQDRCLSDVLLDRVRSPAAHELNGPKMPSNADQTLRARDSEAVAGDAL